MTIQQLIEATQVKFYLGSGYPIGYVFSPTTPKNFVRVEDVTDVSLAGYEEVKFLFKITSPAGNVLYKNAGYDTDDYSVSDFGSDEIYTMPLTANGDVQEGKYKIDIKIQFTDSDTPANDFTTSKTIYTAKYCLCDKPTVKLNLAYDCDLATFTSTDETSYSSKDLTYYSLDRTHIISPPLSSGLGNQTSDLEEFVLDNLWTGSYEAQVKSSVVFRGANTYNDDAEPTLSDFMFYVTGADETHVECNDVLCEMYCGAKKIESKYKAEKNSKIKENYLKLLNLASDYLNFAKESRSCGDTAKLAYWKERFYEETGLDENCDCGCTDGESAPVVPKNSSNGSGTVYIISSDGSVGITLTNVTGGKQFDLKVGFEQSVIGEEVLYKKDVGLFHTIDTDTNKFVPTFVNQIWKDVLDSSVVINPSDPTNLMNDTPQLDMAQYVSAISGDTRIRMRYLYDGKLSIKGKFVYEYSPSGSYKEEIIMYLPFLPSSGSQVQIFSCSVNHHIQLVESPFPCVSESNLTIESDPLINSGIPYMKLSFLDTQEFQDFIVVWIDDIIDLKDWMS